MAGVPIAGPCPDCAELCMILCRRCPGCGLAWPRLRPGWVVIGLIVFLAVFLGLGFLTGTFGTRNG